MSASPGPVQLGIGLALVLAGSLAYSTSFESLASRLGLGQGVAGVIVSPLLTSVPELAVFLAALLGFGSGGAMVAEGTVIGEPLVIATAATPAVVALTGGLHVDRSLARPYIAFVALFPLVLLPGTLEGGRVTRALVAAALLASYAALAALSPTGEGMPEPRLSMSASATMLAASVAAFALGSRLLVAGVLWASGVMGLDPLAVSSLLVPAVTALPESLASLAWARRGVGTLAAASLVGEQVLYATVYPAIAILVRPWPLTALSAAGVVATEAAMAVVALGVRRGRLGPGHALFGLSCLVAYALLLGLAR